jgi:hypothetical protein
VPSSPAAAVPHHAAWHAANILNGLRGPGRGSGAAPAAGCAGQVPPIQHAARWRLACIGMSIPIELQLVTPVASALEEILQYLVRHPNAKDSAEGIAQWWMESPADPHEVRAALDVLVNQGLLTKRAMAGRPALYRVADGKAAELAALLEARRKDRP